MMTCISFIFNEPASTSSESCSFCGMHRVGFAEQRCNQSIQFQRDSENGCCYIDAVLQVQYTCNVQYICMIRALGKNVLLGPYLLHSCHLPSLYIVYVPHHLQIPNTVHTADYRVIGSLLQLYSTIREIRGN